MRRSSRVVGLLFFVLFLMGFQTDYVKFQTGATYSWDKDRRQVTGLLSRPAGAGRSPAVVLLHTCGGLQPHVISAWPRYLTGLGYVVLAADSYTPRGYAKCTNSGTWKNDQTKDAFGALDYLASLPFVDDERIAVMGFSAGASAINDLVIPLSRERTGLPNYKAAISLYGPCGFPHGFPLRSYTEKDIPLMQILGELDRKLTSDCVDATKNKPIEVHVLKGAYHAFDMSVHSSLRKDAYGSPMLYDASKAREARELTRAFLAKYI